MTSSGGVSPGRVTKPYTAETYASLPVGSRPANTADPLYPKRAPMTTTVELPAAPVRHDCADRRRTNMAGAIDALNGCAADLTMYAGNEGVSYLVAERLERLAVELEGFRARDLLNLRAVS